MHLLLKIRSILLFLKFYPIYLFDLSVDMSYITLFYYQLNHNFHIVLCHPNTIFLRFHAGCRNPEKQALIPHDVFQLTGLIDLISTVFTSDPPQPVITTSF